MIKTIISFEDFTRTLLTRGRHYRRMNSINAITNELYTKTIHTIALSMLSWALYTEKQAG